MGGDRDPETRTKRGGWTQKGTIKKCTRCGDTRFSSALGTKIAVLSREEERVVEEKSERGVIEGSCHRKVNGNVHPCLCGSIA